MDVAISPHRASCALAIAFGLAGCGHSSGGSSFGGHPSATVVTLATSPINVVGLAIDAHHAYFAENDYSGAGAIVKVGLDGGAPTTLAAHQASPEAIAVDPSSVYWIEGDQGDGGALLKVALGGGAPATLAAGQSSPGGLVVAGDAVYFTSGSCFSGSCTANVSEVSAQGGAVSTLATGAAGSLTADATNVYVATGSGKVIKIPRGGGAPVTLWFEQTTEQAIAVDSTSVYWTNAAGDVMKIAIGGGHPEALAYQEQSASALAVDSRGVYWSSYDSAANTTGPWGVAMVPLDGGAPVTLATGFRDQIVALASDGTNIYVATYGGVIAKVTPQ
jgi:hypothetical protein